MLASEVPLQLYRNKAEAVRPADDRTETIDGGAVDLLKIYKPLDVHCLGLAVIERKHRASWRWGLGPRTTLTFRLEDQQDVVLRLAFDSPFAGQTIQVRHNRALVATLTPGKAPAEVVIHGVGHNVLHLDYSHWDKPPKLFPNDSRPVAARFSRLALASADGGPLRFPTDSTVAFPYVGSPIENELLARREYAEGKTVLRSLPPVVTLGLTTRCNFQIPCVICDINTRPEEADSSIEAVTIEKAAPLISTAKRLLLHCGGEAMMSKYFDKVIELTSPETTVQFNTHGMLLTPKRADRLLAKGSAIVSFSLDAATPEIYRIMRPSGHFETLLDNIKYYTSKLKELGRPQSHTRINMTVCETNVKDVAAFIDLAHELGVDDVVFSHLNEGLEHVVETVDGGIWDYTKECQFADPERHDDLVLNAWQRAQRIGMPMVFVGPPFLGSRAGALKSIAAQMAAVPFHDRDEETWRSAHHKRYHPDLMPCFTPWQETVVQPTGDIRMCCFHDESKFTIGNIVQNDFLRLWNAEEMVTARRAFFGHGVAPRCHANPCQRCRH